MDSPRFLYHKPDIFHDISIITDITNDDTKITNSLFLGVRGFKTFKYKSCNAAILVLYTSQRSILLHILFIVRPDMNMLVSAKNVRYVILITSMNLKMVRE